MCWETILPGEGLFSAGQTGRGSPFPRKGILTFSAGLPPTASFSGTDIISPWGVNRSLCPSLSPPTFLPTDWL